MARSCERALSASEASFSMVNCKVAMVFLKEAGDGSDLGIGLTYSTGCGVCG